jgi:hypothetical protein
MKRGSNVGRLWNPRRPLWHVVSVLFQVGQIETKGRLQCEESLYLVAARRADVAYKKAKKLAVRYARDTNKYFPKTQSKLRFLGVTEIMAVMEELENGSELGYRKITYSNLRKLKSDILTLVDVNKSVKEGRRRT